MIKKVIKTLLYPHGIIVLFLAALSAVLLVCLLISDDEISAAAIISYTLSAYALTIVCLRLPQIISKIKEFKRNNKLLKAYFERQDTKIKASLVGTFILNSSYGLFNLVLGFVHSSLWYLSLAVYYILIAVVRFLLLSHTRAFKPCEDRCSELKRYRLTAVFLIMINLALSAVLAYMLMLGVTIVHHEITTIAMAAFTFTSLALAIINIASCRKYNSPVFSAAKAVSLTSALVSLITLENAMITVFGDAQNPEFLRIMTAATGAMIELLILVMAVFMAVKSTKELKLNGKK